MSKLHNRTRSSDSIPKKLLREKKAYLVPIYYLLLTSELGREGITNSGSYHFADHIYGQSAKGRFGIGYVLDAILLRLPSARSMRSRYIHAKDEIKAFSKEHSSEELRILAVPSGLAREMFESADELSRKNISWYGIDLDEHLVSQLQEKAEKLPHQMLFGHGDALDSAAYHQDGYDMIISVGLGEFLDDNTLINFYRIVYDKLRPGGRFVTSGMLPHPVSDYLLRNIAEIHTQYRSKADLESLAKAAGIRQVRFDQDKYGLQTLMVAEKA